MTAAEFIARLGPHAKPTKTTNGWQCRCPAHDDQRASLSVTETSGKVLVHCHAGCTPEAVCAAVDVKLADLFADNAQCNEHGKRIVATYDYCDESGTLLYQIVRFAPKDFRQRKPDATTNDGWTWNTKGIRRVPFCLPELLAAIAEGRRVFVVEGEKDVLAVSRAGFCATCNSGGAGKWQSGFADFFKGADVCIVADKDAPGRAHAQQVAASLYGVAAWVRVVELPDVDGKPVKDAADFFAAGGQAAEFDHLTDSAPVFVPELAPVPARRDDSGTEFLDSEGELESETGDEQKSPKQSAATRLVQFADDFAFFHDSQSRPFVRLDVKGHVEVWPVNSTQFRNLLAQTFYKRARKAINRNALADAITTLAGRACYDGPEEEVFLRVAPDGQNILIDLCDDDWRVIEVTPGGWHILDNSPVAFIRTGAMQPLPVPVPAAQGSLGPLWELLNVAPAQRPLVAGALLNYLRPQGPYFVTDFVGEQGSAKSCAAKIMRLLVDPNVNPLRSPPHEERDLLVQAGNNWCVALDNLSSLQPWLSDALCRLSTGGGHSARQLYSDGEEFSLSLKRPVILNGIDDVATRPDLAERALQIELETIPDCRRVPEKELWRIFKSMWPVIFSGLLNGLVCALRELPNLKFNSWPRMADAAQWATAGESAFGFPNGTFLSAYQKNLNEGAVASVEAHPVGLALRRFFDGKTEWCGEPAQLLTALTENAGEGLTHVRHWPRNARALSVCLRRLAPALRRSEINIEFARGRRREIRLSKVGNFASPLSQGGGDDAHDAKM